MGRDALSCKVSRGPCSLMLAAGSQGGRRPGKAASGRAAEANLQAPSAEGRREAPRGAPRQKAALSPDSLMPGCWKMAGYASVQAIQLGCSPGTLGRTLGAVSHSPTAAFSTSSGLLCSLQKEGNPPRTLKAAREPSSGCVKGSGTHSRASVGWEGDPGPPELRLQAEKVGRGSTGQRRCLAACGGAGHRA